MMLVVTGQGGYISRRRILEALLLSLMHGLCTKYGSH